MQNNNWKEYADKCKLPINIDREPLPLKKYPQDLDFYKTVGGATYVVKSHFNKNASDSLLTIISRLCSDDKNL